VADDTGRRLRSLYEPGGGARAIFSSKVGDYRASRPDYPPELFDALSSRCGLNARSLVVDVGAGTGLLTRGLLARRCRVIAVEPNAEMRRACDEALSGISGYRSVEGCAETMPLETASADLVTAAQAFHWFEVARARDECLRVLRRDGQVALIWNDRLSSDPLHVALDALFAEFGGEKRAALVAHEDRKDVPAFFGGDVAELRWPHEQRLDSEALVSLVFSRSHTPARDSDRGRQVEARTRDLFAAHAIDDRVVVRYTTVMIIGRPQPSG
jgi:SAM-dependent methyltransferase